MGKDHLPRTYHRRPSTFRSAVISVSNENTNFRYHRYRATSSSDDRAHILVSEGFFGMVSFPRKTSMNRSTGSVAQNSGIDETLQAVANGDAPVRSSPKSTPNRENHAISRKSRHIEKVGIPIRTGICYVGAGVSVARTFRGLCRSICERGGYVRAQRGLHGPLRIFENQMNSPHVSEGDTLDFGTPGTRGTLGTRGTVGTLSIGRTFVPAKNRVPHRPGTLQHQYLQYLRRSPYIILLFFKNRGTEQKYHHKPIIYSV